MKKRFEQVERAEMLGSIKGRKRTNEILPPRPLTLCKVVEDGHLYIYTGRGEIAGWHRLDLEPGRLWVNGAWVEVYD